MYGNLWNDQGISMNMGKNMLMYHDLFLMFVPHLPGEAL